MTKLAKNEFMEVIREMVSGKVSSVACDVDADDTVLQIAIHGQPYIDVSMEPFYFGYCLDTLTLSKIADIIAKLAGGLKFSNDILENIVTRYEPKSISSNVGCNEKSEDNEVSDEELNNESYDVQLEEQQAKDFKMIEEDKAVLLEHVYPKLVSSPKSSVYRNCVSRNVLDMTLLYYMDIENPHQPNKTPFINEKALKELNITEAELYAAAVMNMLKNWDVSMIHRDVPESANKTANSCFCLTNKQNTNGASVILLPGLLNEISRVLNDNLYIIPFNSNAVMIHPVSVSDLNLLKISLAEFPGDDVLSRNVIFYDKNTNDMSNV